MRNRYLNRIGLKTLTFLLLLALLPTLNAAALEPGSYEVTASKLHFREGPGTDTASQYLLSKGAEITVLSAEGEWAHAEHNGKTGYVHIDYIMIKPPVEESIPVAAEVASAPVEPVGTEAPPTEASAATAPEGMVKVTLLNFREQPNTDAAVIEQLPYGTIVEIVEHQGEWTYISFNGMRGYLYSEHLLLPDENGDYFGDKDEVIAFARQYLGYRYRYGGSSPSTGFDCGGFVRYVYSNFGVELPMGATSQYNTLSWKVAREELQPGDLIFFRAPGTKNIGHVGIYIGEGRFIHATKPGDVVSIDTVNSGYYNTYYYGAARIG